MLLMGLDRTGRGETDVGVGVNVLDSWATIVDCGDAPLTWLDNNVAFKQLDKSHLVRRLIILKLMNPGSESVSRSSPAEKLPTQPSPKRPGSSHSEATTQRHSRPCDPPINDGVKSP